MHQSLFNIDITWRFYKSVTPIRNETLLILSMSLLWFWTSYILHRPHCNTVVMPPHSFRVPGSVPSSGYCLYGDFHVLLCSHWFPLGPPVSSHLSHDMSVCMCALCSVMDRHVFLCILCISASHPVYLGSITALIRIKHLMEMNEWKKYHTNEKHEAWLKEIVLAKTSTFKCIWLVSSLWLYYLWLYDCLMCAFYSFALVSHCCVFALYAVLCNMLPCCTMVLKNSHLTPVYKSYMEESSFTDIYEFRI